MTAPRQPEWAGSDHACGLVGEKHRSAVGSRDAERDARPVGHERVAPWLVFGSPRVGHDNGGCRMVLVGGDESAVGQAKQALDPGAVLANGLLVVIRAVADVEGGIDSL